MDERTKQGWKTIYLGFWKPIQMPNPVYDFPLCMMDASTFNIPEDVLQFKTEMSHISNGKESSFENMGGHLHYSSEQKWYYYPDMTTEEMIMFTHLGPDCKYANPHGSFRHPSAPEDGTFVSRMSMETRCLVQVPPSN